MVYGVMSIMKQHFLSQRKKFALICLWKFIFVNKLLRELDFIPSIEDKGLANVTIEKSIIKK